MRNSESRLVNDMSYAKTPSFMNLCRVIKDSHFTRSRKLPLHQLILSVLARTGKTLHMEIRAFAKLLILKDSISKAGYHKQRKKLNPHAFFALSRNHAQNFYQDHLVKTFHGFLILAVDGAAINIPTTKETLSTYGNASKPDMKPQAQIGLSSLFDTQNKMMIDCSINRNHFSEREQALLHIDRMAEVIGEHPSILLFDRGYPSGEFLIDLLERQQKFLIRLSSKMFKREQQQMKKDDRVVTIVFDQPRINVHRGTLTADKLKKVGKIQLRFTRILLPSGEYEYFASNLTLEEFATQDIGDLYRMRWGIETAFDDLKNKLHIENFTGTKPILLEQDIYATFYLCNIINGIIFEAQSELDKEKKSTQYKHKMAINKNIAIGIMKEELIHILTDTNDRRREQRMNNLIKEIKSNLLPIRKNRHYTRKKGNFAGKFPNSRKRSF